MHRESLEGSRTELAVRQAAFEMVGKRLRQASTSLADKLQEGNGLSLEDSSPAPRPAFAYQMTAWPPARDGGGRAAPRGGLPNVARIRSRRDGGRVTRTEGRIPVQSWEGGGVGERRSWAKRPCKVTSLLCDRREVASHLWAAGGEARVPQPRPDIESRLGTRGMNRPDAVHPHSGARLATGSRAQRGQPVGSGSHAKPFGRRWRPDLCIAKDSGAW